MNLNKKIILIFLLSVSITQSFKMNGMYILEKFTVLFKTKKQETTLCDTDNSSKIKKDIDRAEKELLLKIKSKKHSIIDEQKKMNSLNYKLATNLNYFEKNGIEYNHAHSKQKKTLSYLKCESLKKTFKELKKLVDHLKYLEDLEKISHLAHIKMNIISEINKIKLKKL